MNRELGATPNAGLTELLSDLQARGARWDNGTSPGLSRVGGAGPSDHKAIKLGGQVIMVPIHTGHALQSPYSFRSLQGAKEDDKASGGEAVLLRDNEPLARVRFPTAPRFYKLSSSDGTPMWKLATLHAEKVLATTVLQNCIRYANRSTSCQFCAIGQSLAARSTIARKTPTQLSEVAKAAVELDAVEQLIMTTGTPPGKDRGAALLCESAAAVKAAVPIPIQVQCEPPEDPTWYHRLKDAGADALGMHVEAVTEAVRKRIMPGKAEVSFQQYLSAFEAAVPVFGWGQVSTYILAGLGDSADAILSACQELATRGVYPFVVPFVPIGGTPLAEHPAPSPALMQYVLDGVAEVIAGAGLSAHAMSAGCGRCGACSTLRAREASRTLPPEGVRHA